MLHPLSTRQSRSLLAILCLGAALAAAPAFASGGHSSDGSGGNVPAAPAPGRSVDQGGPDDLTTCPKGKMWDVKHKTCIHMRSEALPDDAVADYAYALAKADRYDEALQTLDLMKDGNTAEALNYRGYATRKLGRTDEGIGYYLRSVALDPHYAKVREYLGEAYVIKGRIDLARDQLGTIKTLCGTDCEPYRDLSGAITAAPSL